MSPTPDVHALVGAYVLDALDDIERAAVERHLRTCASCSREVVELRATAARLADATIVAPPAHLRDRVLGQASRTRQLPAGGRFGGPSPDAPVVRRWRNRTAAAVAAGIIALGAAGATYAIQEDRVRDATAAADAARAEAERAEAILAAPDAVVASAPAADGGSLVVVSSASLNAAVVTRVGMPALDPGRVYQLWFGVGGGFVSAGLMPGESAVLEGIAGAAAIAVSTEPAGGSPRPTNPVGAVKLG